MHGTQLTIASRVWRSRFQINNTTSMQVVQHLNMSWSQLPAELRSFIFSYLTDLDDQWASNGSSYFAP
jgi:hypothetical protein